MIEILDHGDLLRIGFDDVVKYHGRSSIGGAALGFKLLEFGLPLLWPGELPRRDGFAMLTAFPGPGLRDAVELVTRAVTAGTYRVDTDCGPPEAPEAPRGRYYFRLEANGRHAALAVRPGIVRQAFIDLLREQSRRPLDAAELASLKAMKKEMAARVIALPAAEVCRAL